MTERIKAAALASPAASDVEAVARLGEAFFALSSFLPSLLTENDAAHTAYEKVVAAFQALSAIPARSDERGQIVAHLRRQADAVVGFTDSPGLYLAASMIERGDDIAAKVGGEGGADRALVASPSNPSSRFRPEASITAKDDG